MILFILVVGVVAPGSHAQVAAADQAQAQAAWMLNRLTGVRHDANSPLITEMAQLIRNNRPREAAAIATNQQHFLTVAVREMAAQMSTRSETVREPLNDMTAAFVAFARDELDARQLLYGNFYYRGNAQTPLAEDKNVVPDMLLSNAHYDALERTNQNWAATLIRVDGQVLPTGADSLVANPDPAGVLTSHAFMGAHAIAGTNRRLVEYAFRAFMCTPLVGWADTGASDGRIGRDIDRQPGGDPVKFQTSCKGCHTVMDGFRGAFAKFDYVDNVGAGDRRGAIIHADNGVGGGAFRANKDSRGVMYKMNRDNVIQYGGGFISQNDSFVNNADRGANLTRFAWRGYAPEAGPLATRTTGVHAFGRLLANSPQFSRCMAKRAFDVVCKHEVDEGVAEALYESLRLDFENNGYSLKKLFQAVAVNSQCRI